MERHVTEDLDRLIRLKVNQHYTGKKGGKTQERFYESCVRFIGFLIWRYHRSSDQQGRYQDAVMFARSEEGTMVDLGIQNPRRVRLFLMNHGILEPVIDEMGRDYSYRLENKRARRYRVKIGESSVLPLTRLQ